MGTVAPPTRRDPKAAARPARHAIYVFELPVRIVHWVIVLCLIVLSFTGYYIHHPFLSGSGMPGHPGFTMGEMRFVHEATGFVFIAAVLFRIYWSFAGNRYVRWGALLPVTKAQRRDLRETIRFYAFLNRRPPRLNGHNPLAGLAYVVLYLGFILTILTGLGLFAWVIRTPAWTTLFAWTWSVVSIPTLRLVHFLLMFAYGAFAIHHVYSAVLYDIEERNGEMSSIITGWKADLLEDEIPRDDPRRDAA
jgi:Ni/Fe-hydrogenase 1 B-type cytochrome subunit